ncbi:pro-resilin-like [Trichogramma pretiosum]|uniref:pro-resilin-like n=1 Tax=Trichogramma pretiosum TaxID=7493 RepID=UPI0006C944AE|nr:pro-resilin-like [Trichogramma pretiosum]
MLIGISRVQLTLLCLFLGTHTTLGDLPPGTRTRANTYLPPDQPKSGYDYNKPSGPGFGPGPAPRPPQGPPARPPAPPAPRPPAPRPPAPPSIPSPGRPSPPGGGYPAPGQRPSPPFPDYAGSPSGPSGQPGGADHVHEPGMPFDFNYAVKEDAFGNDYSHNAISDGDVTRGEYRVQLPDGRTQIVRYTADWKNGFNAQVSYEGEPRFGPPAGGGGGGGGGGGAGNFQGY